MMIVYNPRPCNAEGRYCGKCRVVLEIGDLACWCPGIRQLWCVGCADEHKAETEVLKAGGEAPKKKSPKPAPGPAGNVSIEDFESIIKPQFAELHKVFSEVQEIVEQSTSAMAGEIELLRAENQDLKRYVEQILNGSRIVARLHQLEKVVGLKNAYATSVKEDDSPPMHSPILSAPVEPTVDLFALAADEIPF